MEPLVIRGTEGVKIISQYHNITITKWIEEKL